MKLHIGGEEKKEGWKILNIQQKPNVDFIGDITDLGQFEDNSIEEIYASHVVEHVAQKKVETTLKGIHRVLKDNGKFVLDILVPDPDFLYREEKYRELPVMDFKDSKTGELIEIFETCKYDVDTEVCDLSWEYRYKENPSYNKVFDYQMRMYYPDTINRLLIDAGLDIEDRFGDYECSRFNESSQLQIYVCK